MSLDKTKLLRQYNTWSRRNTKLKYGDKASINFLYPDSPRPLISQALSNK